jgi:hypothetical protein
VARPASKFPDDPIIVVTNRDEDCLPAAFRARLDELLAATEPELETIRAADALRELRVDSERSPLCP